MSLVRILRWALMATSALSVLMVFVSAYRRLHYPWSLDWIEEGNLLEVARVLGHQPIYTAPTLDYVPYIYAPLFYWMSAAFARLLGPGFAAMRMVSILSSIGIFAGVYLFVTGEVSRTKGKAESAGSPKTLSLRVLSGMVALGVFAVAYPYTSAFLDVGRVDMLCLCFGMYALLLTRRGHLVAAALLWTLAVHTKQGILPIAVLALLSEWKQPVRLLLGLGSFLLFTFASVALLAHRLGPWYTFFVFRVAPGFKLDPRVLAFWLPHEVLTTYSTAFLLILTGVLAAPPASWRTRRVSFWLLTFAGMVGYTAFLRAHAGAAINANLPACLWIALASGVAFGRIGARLRASDLAASTQTYGTMALFCAPMLQMIPFLNGPSFWVPTAEDRQARAHFIEGIRSIPGDVLVLDHAQYSREAGKTMYADGKALDGLVTSRATTLGATLTGQLAESLRTHRFSAVVVDGSLEQVLRDDRLPKDFASLYPVQVRVAENAHPLPFTQPDWMFLPCPGAGGVDANALFPGAAIDASSCSASGNATEHKGRSLP